MARTSAIEFARQVKLEVAKVTWPSWNETYRMTLMVFMMVFFAAVFFFAADQALSYLVRLLLNVGA